MPRDPLPATAPAVRATLALPAAPALVPEAQVAAAQVQQVQTRLRVGALGSIVVALVSAVPLLPLFERRAALTWLAALLAVHSLRLVQGAAFAKPGVQPRHVERWRRWFAITSAATGASWALGPVLLVALAPPEAPAGTAHAAMLVATLLAASAVAVAQLAAQWRALAAFLSFALLPSAAVLWLEPDGAMRLLGAMLAMAWAMLLIAGRSAARDNEALVRAELGLSQALIGAQAIAADLQVASQQRHLESERLAHLLAATNAASAEWQLDTQRVRLNERGTAMLGLPEMPSEGVPLAPLATLVHTDDLPEAQRQVHELLAGTRTQCEFEVRLRHREGHWIWTRAAARLAAQSPGAAASAAPRIVTAAFIDIQEAKAKERRWRSRAELSADWFWESDAEHRVTLLSDGIRDGLPIPHERLVGRRLAEVPELRAVDGGWSVLAGKLGAQQMFAGFVCQLRADNGTLHYIELDGRPRHSESGLFLGYEGVGRDVTARRRATQALEESLALVDALFDAMAVPVVLKDATGRCVRMNKAYLDLVAAPQDASGPAAVDEGVDAGAAAVHRDIDAQLLATPGQRRYEVRQRLPDGRWIDALVHKSTLVGAGGQASGLVGTLIDITEQKGAARVLAEAKEAAELANRAKSSFLATMSHELRTPLNAVIGAAQLLRTTHGDESARATLVETIETSGSNLLGLVENIMDLSRIEAGALTITPEDFNLLECAEAAVATSAVPAHAKGLSMVCIVEPDLPVWRRGDLLRLRQVFLNLLGNAVKFTHKGEVALRLARGEGDSAVRITVSDTGIGIAEAALAHIFQPFRQADAGTNRRFGGSGLGLAIVHQLVQAMGGHIAVRSQLGQGTAFEISLALPPAAQRPEPPPRLGHPVAYFEPHEPSAEALQALLQRLGCGAQRITQPQQLAPWAARHGGRGWLLLASDSEEAAAVLGAAAPLIEPARIIGLTGEPNHADNRVHASLGVQRQLAKPVLRAKLVSAFGAASQAAGVPPWPLAAQLADAAAVLVVEDDPTNRQIVCSMLAHAGYAVGLAATGLQALDFVAQRDWGLVLMDWQMPDMDGLEVTRRLRAGECGPRGQRVPIVALTANAFAEDRTACLAAGMNDFLTKPVHLASLVATVGRWCEAGGPIRPAPLQAPVPEPEPEPEPALPGRG